jgi:hypothetical protein
LYGTGTEENKAQLRHLGISEYLRDFRFVNGLSVVSSSPATLSSPLSSQVAAVQSCVDWRGSSLESGFTPSDVSIVGRLNKEQLGDAEWFVEE